MKKKTVLIAPAWRGLQLVREKREDYFEQIISVLREFNVNIIIKLHTASFNKIMADFAWQEKLRRLSENSDVRTDDVIDDIPALMHSDVLITDISSRAYNFMLLDKPVILFLPADGFCDQWDQWDKKRIQLMRQGSFIAKSPSDIKDIFEQLTDQTVMSRERMRVAKQCFANHGNATEVVVREIKEGA